MILDYFQLIFALLLLWPRGYILIYLIDRSKSMSFGFKFFVGWMLGIGGFTLDVFAANIYNHLSLAPWVFYIFTTAQLFGFSFMVLVMERKLPYPNFKRFMPFIKKHLASFKNWSSLEKIAMVFLLTTLVLRLGMSVWTVTNIPTYEFDAWNNWNLKAKVIYTEKEVPLDETSQFYLGGGIQSYPLQDAMLKVWMATLIGDFQDRYVNLISVVYYILLIAIFYFTLPSSMNRLLRIIATYALSSLPLLFIHSHVAYADILFSIYLFIAIASLFYYIAGAGNSFYYLSGMGLAFSIWTKNEGLTILFPLLVFTTLLLVIMKKVKLKDFFLSWFFAVLTVAAWIAFRVIRKLDLLSGDSSTFELVFNSQFFAEVLSNIFLRSHFNILWILVVAIIIFRFKLVWQSLSLRYLMISLLLLFIGYNSIILFTDKALDLSAAARVNLQLAPVAMLFVVFSIQKIFAKIK